MGEEDVRRQKLNVFKMKALGSRGRPRRPAAAGRCATPSTRPCATGWPRVETTHYIIGSVVGPHPFPMIVRDFQSVIGRRRGSSAWSRSAGCPTWSWPASAAAATRPACSIRSSTTPASSWSASRPAAAASGRASMPPRSAYGQPGVLHGTLQLRAAGRRRPDRRGAFGLGRARLSRRRPGAQLLERHAAACATPASATTRRCRLPPVLAAGGHFAGPGDGPRRGRGACGLPPSASPRMSWWSVSPAAATRIATRWPGCQKSEIRSQRSEVRAHSDF